MIVLAALGAANAQNVPESLRGSFGPQFYAGSYLDWSGPYFGAQAGFTNLDSGFGDAIGQWVGLKLGNSQLQTIFHPDQWTVMPSDVSNSGSYGVFFGYNMQWERLVLGFDVAYNRMASLRTSSSGSIRRKVLFLDPEGDLLQDIVRIRGHASSELVDDATLRARAGYAIGQFLPYAILGMAVGRFNYATSATVSVKGNDNIPRTSMTDSKDGAIAAGLVTGLGIDVALMPNLFLRGEWEFVMFGAVSNITNTINTGRVGLALRF